MRHLGGQILDRICQISNDKYQVHGNQVDFEAERKAMQVKMEAEVQELQTHLKLDFY